MVMTAKLTNKVAIVTGAASGMGKAIAEAYAREGARLVLADINAESLAQVVDEITQDGGQRRVLSRIWPKKRMLKR